jgi:hypothetical protein
MANEIKLRLSFRVENGNFKDNWQGGQIDITQNNPGRGGYVQVIGTSEETIVFGDVTTEGILFMVNLDNTNFIEWGPDSTGMVRCGKIMPGKPAWFRVFPGVVLKAKADTASCKLDARLYED